MDELTGPLPFADERGSGWRAQPGLGHDDVLKCAGEFSGDGWHRNHAYAVRLCAGVAGHSRMRAGHRGAVQGSDGSAARRWDCAADCHPHCYGLRKRSSSCSSCWLRLARTRMWRTMVPEMRGGKLAGALWQREQFWAQMRSPSSPAGAPLGAWYCLTRGWGPEGVVDCVYPGRGETTAAPMAATMSRPGTRCFARRVIFLSMRETESDRRCRFPRCFRCWLRKTDGYSWSGS